ncbi:restriction endonuclease subunit S [Myroides pelagicus]|uniref:restriction endonuclease subunit S n=1 Tax=Myroides pelagicus TaxID=270914 RepID=UPI002DB5AF87|nr:restriction endonuclease subunit S [Myroides pelagicus]MEC4114769.1 restriction endonuclease subunit S [Myroides pelagicus]
MEINIDKSNWSKVNFGDVAIQMKGTVDRDNTDLRYYVKGEHMNSEDVHIREFGELTDEYLGPAFIRYFKEGDILYGSRRTYLKKVAVAHFEGITSNTTFVINAKENVIDKRLLPFLMLSDKFTEHSIMHSKGSVNPYINWKDLANYEFLLPPKEQQAELAELLWAMDAVIEKDLEVLKRLEDYMKLYIEDFFIDTNRGLNKIRLSEIADINKFSLTNKTSKDYEFSYIDLSSIQPRKLNELDRIKFENSPSRARRIIKDKSIIISTVRPYQLCNIYIEKNDQDYIASTGTAVINLKNEINPKFLFEQFFTNRYVKFIEDRMTGTNYPAITAKDLEDFEIYFSIDENLVENFITKTEQLNTSKIQLESKLKSSKALQKALINQIF